MNPLRYRRLILLLAIPMLTLALLVSVLYGSWLGAIPAAAAAPGPAEAGQSARATTNVCTLPGQIIEFDNAAFDGDDIVVDSCIGTINGSHSFNSLHVINNGQLVHSATFTIGLRLTITNDVLVEAGSAINASARGYAGGLAWSGDGEGPGGGTRGDGPGGGGGHGGFGSGRPNYYGEYSLGGQAYGDLYRPVTSGSGGAGCLANSYCNSPGGDGGAGGGVVYLNVGGTLTLDGSILSNGGNAVVYPQVIPGSGGAGGSIWLTAGTLAGNGAIRANGGHGAGSYSRLGGGGGRIAVYYGSSSFGGVVRAQGGQTTYVQNGSGTDYAAGAGTIYLRDTNEAVGKLIIANRPLENARLPDLATTPLDGGLVTASEPHDFTTFDITGSALVGTNRPVTVALGSSFATDLWAIQGRFDGVTTTVGAGVSISVTRPTTATNDIQTSRFDGLLAMDPTADLRIGLGSWLELHEPLTVDEVLVTDGGRLGHVFYRDGISPTLSLTANSVTVDAGSQINVGARGFRGAPAGVNAPGGGPGGGQPVSLNGSGAGHGGVGGGAAGDGSGGGVTYGSGVAPSTLGSGGSAGWGGGGSSMGAGGNGGGRVHLVVAGTLTVNGGIYANGGSGQNQVRDGGGGSGGSIWAETAALTGSGALRANGGSGQNSGGGGGGGRIAIDAQSDSFVGAITTNGGGGVASGAIGTILPDSLFGVSQSASPNPGSYGATLTYTLRVSNNGTAAITAGVTNTRSPDVTPPGVQTWTANIAAGQTWVQDVVVTVNPDAADPLTNLLEATVAGQTRGVSLDTSLEDIPISGLAASNDSPTLDGSPVNFSASVVEGTNVSYSWDFGDGAPGTGPVTDRVYDAPGVYTATVTASNSRGSAQAITVVTVEPLPNFRGVAFEDIDGDGVQGAGEPGLPGVLVTAAGPAGTLNDTTASNGSWRIDSGDAGTYVLDAVLSGYALTSDAPVQAALPALGSTYVNFGLAPAPAAGNGAIVGRVFADGNGNGFADPVENGFAGVTVTLYDDGSAVDTTVTGANGSFSFPAVAPGVYALSAEAPAGFFPTTLGNEGISVAGGQVASALFGFTGGGDLVGIVTNGGGYPVSGITLVLNQEDMAAQTAVTDSDGEYLFDELAPGEYSVRIVLPTDYQLPDGQDIRQVAILGDGQTVENWIVNRQGRLYVRSFLDNQIPFVPVGGATFVISDTGGYADTVITDGSGQVIVDGLPAGQYVITPRVDPGDGFTVSPQRRVIDVSLDSSAFLDFYFDFPRSVRARCERWTQANAPHGPAFPCIVTATVISGTAGPPGTVVDTIQLSGQRTALFTDLDAGTYRITITPDPVVGQQSQWPIHEAIVALGDGDHREVSYPYNPTPGTTRVWGYAYYDRNQDGQRQDFGGTQFASQDEAHDSAANGMVVSLYDDGGALVMTTTTAIHPQYQYGYYAFDGVPVGDFQVVIALRSGLFGTTSSHVQRSVDGIFPPPPAHFGYVKQFGSSIGGLVFYDNNGNGDPDPEIDDPVVGVELILRDPGGADVETVSSNSYGSYSFYPIASGEYEVVLVPPAGSENATVLERPVALPDGDTSLTLHYPLMPDDGRTRAIVYVDQNFNEEPDDGEYVAGVILRRETRRCGSQASPSGNSLLAITGADGLALFPPAAQSGCVIIDDPDTLPPGVTVARGEGLEAPGGTGFVWIRLVPAGTVTVTPFWDQDGDNVRDAGETVVQGAMVGIPGERTIQVGVNGATFSLEEGSYDVTVSPPGGMSVAVPLPLVVAAASGAGAAYDVPLRYTGQVAGTLTSSGGSPTWANLVVVLEDINLGTQRFATISAADSYYQFQNLAPGSYQLKLSSVPDGWALLSQPIFTYNPGGTVVQNLTLARLGSVSGLVYLDNNGSGNRDGGEPVTGQYDVVLSNNGGFADVVVDVASDGSFAIPNLVPGVQYVATVDLNSNGYGAPGSAITENSGWFTAGSGDAGATIGVYPYTYAEDINGDKFNTVYGRVYEQVGSVKNPHAGAEISYYPWNGGTGCSVVGSVLGTTASDADGYYRLLTDFIPDSQKHFCVKVTHLPGFQHDQPSVVQTTFYYQSTNGMVYYPGVYDRDLIVTQAGTQRSGGDAQLAWSAFRDDNGNGLRDGDEPVLPDVVLSSGPSSAASGLNGDGLLTGLADGRHVLAFSAPAGYVPAGALTTTVWISATDVSLGAVPFRLAGRLSGSVFGDADGDGWRAPDELGLGNLEVTLSGPEVTGTLTALDGSFSVAGLPDGVYQVAVATPAGFAARPPQTISLANGGDVQIGLRPTGLVGGAVYEDWDGDGRRLPDEPLVTHPVTVTLSGGPEVTLAAGHFLFWDVADGFYEVTPLWSAVVPATVDTAAGGTAALPAMTGGTVRGTVWHDANGDGLRQPGEPPLSGRAVSMAGWTALTDGTGRFQFLNVVTGTHAVTVNLPDGLEVPALAATVDALRGAVVGVPAAALQGYRLYLPGIMVAPGAAGAAGSPDAAAAAPSEGSRLPGPLLSGPALMLAAVGTVRMRRMRTKLSEQCERCF